jgi:hypothetical protein
MRKNFITKEYTLEPVNGTFNMKEMRTFFASKILELEDVIKVDENNITWSESIDNTQGLGLDNQNKIFNSFDIKKQNHTIRIYPNQSEAEKNQYTRWEILINIREIIKEYLFASLKRSRAFSGVTNNKTILNSVNLAIYEYIDLNIFPRIKFFNIDLYVRYYTVSELQDNGVVALRYNNVFRNDLITPPIISGESSLQFQRRSEQFKESLNVKNFQINTDSNKNIATVLFKQTESSARFKFDYYFDIIYVKS